MPSLWLIGCHRANRLIYFQLRAYQTYRVRLMFRGGFGFVYYASRWPFATLKTAKIRFSKSGNEVHILVHEI